MKSAYAHKWRKELQDVVDTFKREIRVEDVPFDIKMPKVDDIIH